MGQRPFVMVLSGHWGIADTEYEYDKDQNITKTEIAFFCVDDPEVADPAEVVKS
jgi:hypothetical protein